MTPVPSPKTPIASPIMRVAVRFSSKMVLRVFCFLQYFLPFYEDHPFFEKNTLRIYWEILS